MPQSSALAKRGYRGLRRHEAPARHPPSSATTTRPPRRPSPTRCLLQRSTPYAGRATPRRPGHGSLAGSAARRSCADGRLIRDVVPVPRQCPGDGGKDGKRMASPALVAAPASRPDHPDKWQEQAEEPCAARWSI